MVWTPASLTNLLAWYDASDYSTITQAAGQVSQWRDKSGNGEHIANPTGAEQPQCSGTGITFDGVDDMLFRASRFGLATNPDLTVAAVAYKPAFANTYGFSWVIGTTPAGNSDTLGGSTGAEGWAWRHQGGSNVFGPVALSTYEVAVWQRAAGSDYQSSSFRLNGSDETATSSSNPTGVPLSTAAYFSVGSSYNLSGDIQPASISYLDVVIAETDDVGEAQLLEGYLAWKRGLQATLPLDHPYRWDGTLFGFGRYFQPSDARRADGTSEVLWYSPRAQHDDTITEAAGKVSQWSDINGSSSSFAMPIASFQPALDETELTDVRVISAAGGFKYMQAIFSPGVQIKDLSVIGMHRRTVDLEHFFELDGTFGSRTRDHGLDVLAYDYPSNTDGPAPPNALAVNRVDVTRSNGEFSRYINGAAAAQFNHVFGTRSGSPVWSQLHAFAGDSLANSMEGYYVDLVFLLGAYPLDDLQQVEAYTAWTAGQEALLESAHPYKAALPLNPVVIDIDSISDGLVKFSSDESPTVGEVTYLWDFGDGVTSSAASPYHGYETDGTHTVELTITDDYSTRSATVEITTTVDYVRPSGYGTTNNYNAHGLGMGLGLGLGSAYN